jgi:mono/diheme cytochrome c family protein
MSRRRWVWKTAGALTAVLLLAVGGIYGMSAAQMGRTYALPAPPSFIVPTDSAAIARGEHLVHAVVNCAECHGDDLGGKLIMDAGPIGVAFGPNLTAGAGGIGADYSDADWVRAIRHGLRPDGRSMLIMPSETFTHLTDADLAAVIAYLRTLPPVDRTLPRTRLRILGRFMLATGRLPLLVAPKTLQLDEREIVQPAPTVAYGRYLADVSGCRGCHGLQLSGGRVAGPPGTPLAANLTPAGMIGWTEQDFFTALREGRRPDGTMIDEFMPWRYAGRMSDDELRAIWLYLRSVPPVEFGNR